MPFDAVSYARARDADAAARHPLVQMGQRACYPNQPAITAADIMVRAPLYAPVHADWTDISLVWANFQRSNNSDAANAVTITAAIEYPVGTFRRVSFDGGALSVTLPPNGVVQSVPMPVSIKAGELWWIRYYLMPSGGTVIPSTSMFVGGAAESAGYILDGGADLTMSGNVTAASNAAIPLPPVAILGRPSRRRAVTAGYEGMPLTGVAIWGDSITVGVGDDLQTDRIQGFAARALTSLGLGYTHLGYSATTVYDISQRGNRWRRLYAAQGVSTILTNYGTNDIGDGRTVAQIQTDYTNWAGEVRETGRRLIMSTITPRTDPTNTGYYNTDTSATTTAIADLNAWIRTDPFGWGIIDVAAAVADPANARFWRTDYGALTGDGLHPPGFIVALMRDAVMARLPVLLSA